MTGIMRLRRSDLSRPGIERRRRGRGFSYHFQGKPVSPADRKRIEALVIPPAWTDVWISPGERGHIQAIGTDAAGRRQYRYHDDWRARRDREKFAHLHALARVLPKLRRTIRTDLTGRGLTRSRVLAAAARLLDRGAIRVGGEAYAVDDPDLGEATFGLATIRRDHVQVRKDTVALSFPGKGGAETEVDIEDPELAPVIRALLKRNDANEELLGYRVGSEWRDVHSSDINDYLREISGADITAKDFRTWHGTVAATVSLCLAGECTSPTARKRAVARAMREASQILGNTPAVARSSYVDPRLVDAFSAGDLPPLPAVDPENGAADVFADPRVWQRAEKITIAALRS
jgi:DNA topoisomerase I